MINRPAFFAAIRSNPFARSLSQSQVDGTSAILDAWEASRLTDIRWLSYMLATTFHETAREMQPINEKGGTAYFTKLYEGRRDLGNTKKGDGARFHGRGYVQLTGRANYQKASDKFGQDFIGNPDLALRPDLAAKIMFSGMTEGWFTGKELSDYISGSTCDYKNARRIINGLDKAVTIAGYAIAFQTALEASAAAAPPPPDIPAPEPAVPLPPDVPLPEPTDTPPTGGVSIWKLLLLVGIAVAIGAAVIFLRN